MAVAIAKQVPVFGPDSAGACLRPREFDRAEFVEGFRYELIDGVLIVSPIPLPNERDPNDELGHLLRQYLENNPQEATLNKTLPEHVIKVKKNRRRPDRVIWAGLGRKPRANETPTIVVEFVSKGKRNRRRDYEVKRSEYLAIGVREYWVIDRFERTMTVFSKQGKTFKKQVIQENQSYSTPILPGFALALARLLSVADDWLETEFDII